ncbi:hypothetical protein C2857_000538 [Epichloe festucae Fl1]|uniref:Macro domain-like protein n=1 Tax=Epichloe festucae (strain Fl1) TaxID=877507 RepID=A0A7S9KJF6_EPIFF|nr:hypothetical protein C2857_000538 [Epichloe festucae Fl1]
MANSTTSSGIPHIHLLCMQNQHSEAFAKAAAKHKLPTSITFETHNAALQFVPSSSKFDLVVSPANSYGRLDGGFDDAISRAFSPRNDYLALTRVAQAKLYDEWRGFAPPGTCTLVRIPDDFRHESKNVWGTKYLALCPTMRTPQPVEWDREIVYESTWSLLVTIDKHNRRTCAGCESDADPRISSILIPPLATGIGKVSPERWAAQMVMAMKHFVDAKQNPRKWSRLTPMDIFDHTNEVVDTWSM